MEGNTDDYPIQTVKFERSSNSHVNFLIPLEFYEFVPKYSCTSQSTPDLSSSKFVEDMFLSRYSYVNELGESQNKSKSISDTVKRSIMFIDTKTKDHDEELDRVMEYGCVQALDSGEKLRLNVWKLFDHFCQLPLPSSNNQKNQKITNSFTKSSSTKSQTPPLGDSSSSSSFGMIKMKLCSSFLPTIFQILFSKIIQPPSSQNTKNNKTHEKEEEIIPSQWINEFLHHKLLVYNASSLFLKLDEFCELICQFITFLFHKTSSSSSSNNQQTRKNTTRNDSSSSSSSFIPPSQDHQPSHKMVDWKISYSTLQLFYSSLLPSHNLSSHNQPSSHLNLLNTEDCDIFDHLYYQSSSSHHLPSHHSEEEEYLTIFPSHSSYQSTSQKNNSNLLSLIKQQSNDQRRQFYKKLRRDNNKQKEEKEEEEMNKKDEIDKNNSSTNQQKKKKDKITNDKKKKTNQSKTKKRIYHKPWKSQNPNDKSSLYSTPFNNDWSSSSSSKSSHQQPSSHIIDNQNQNQPSFTKYDQDLLYYQTRDMKSTNHHQSSFSSTNNNKKKTKMNKLSQFLNTQTNQSISQIKKQQEKNELLFKQSQISQLKSQSQKRDELIQQKKENEILLKQQSKQQYFNKISSQLSFLKQQENNEMIKFKNSKNRILQREKEKQQNQNHPFYSTNSLLNSGNNYFMDNDHQNNNEEENKSHLISLSQSTISSSSSHNLPPSRNLPSHDKLKEQEEMVVDENLTIDDYYRKFLSTPPPSEERDDNTLERRDCKMVNSHLSNIHILPPLNQQPSSSSPISHLSHHTNNTNYQNHQNQVTIKEIDEDPTTDSMRSAKRYLDKDPLKNSTTNLAPFNSSKPRTQNIFEPISNEINW